MSLTVLHFAAARERAGTGQETVEWTGGTVRQLLEALVARHPTLRSLVPHLRVAVNQEFLPLEAEVPDGAEVALVPPVAGGSG
ncbi:MAG TPA: MoaD/ThiS family protein, partial [Myxococcaceae bacterium]|nr:MoaD/ThiS family protein [Myxococcaceae bacterium]